MASEQEKQNARDGGYTVSLVGKGTYDTYVVYLHGVAQAGEFALVEDAWNEAVARRWRDQNEH